MNPQGYPKARAVRVRVLSGADAPALEAAINAWLDAAGEIEFLFATAPAWDGTALNVTIYYSE